MVAYSFLCCIIFILFILIFRKELNFTIQKTTLNALSNPSALRVTCLLPNVTHAVTFCPRTRCTYFRYSDKLYFIHYTIQYIIYTQVYIYTVNIHIYVYK